jgi:hypothetical protein
MYTPNVSSKPCYIEIPARGLCRRHFIYTTALAASSIAASAYAARRPNIKSPNEKLNIGLIGVTGKGMEDSRNLAGAGENIIAMCDVDANALANGASPNRFPNAKQYRDYRVMIEKEKELDAVTVSIPDHQHAPATMLAMQAGRHVYCQKPLTHTVSEARAITEAARKYKVATQMGNQGHSSEGIRRLCEMIWSGAIGNVKEVLCAMNAAKWYPICGLARHRCGRLRRIGNPNRRQRRKRAAPVDNQDAVAAAAAAIGGFIIRSPGAVGGILVAARWATWRAT